jgi:transcriptional regulator with XRE-family HTH domain
VISDPPRARQLFAAELRSVRQRSHKTLRELQRSTFASDSALSRYLSGASVPPWRVVEALCDEVGDDPETLRSAWVRAKGGRQPVVDRMLTDDLISIRAQMDTAIRRARHRGENVPAPVLALLRLSEEALAQLRRSGERVA